MRHFEHSSQHGDHEENGHANNETNEPRHRKVRSSRYAHVAVEIGNGEYASKADARVVVKAAADQPVGAGASVGGWGESVTGGRCVTARAVAAAAFDDAGAGVTAWGRSG